MIRVEQVTVRFGPTVAVDGVSLVLPAGETVLLGGASGCGKSTLLRVMAGIVPHVSPATFEGRVLVGGTDTIRLRLDEIAQRVGLVFQNPSTQLFHATVDEEVAFGPGNLGLSAAEIDRRRTWALDVTGLDGLGSRLIRTLSGGERQRVALAAVLAMRPAVLALDEPLASLDVEGTRRLLAVLRELNQRSGTTIVMAEHRLREGALAAARTILMDRGTVVADGPTGDVLGRRALLRTLGLRRPALEAQDDWERLIVPDSPDAGSPLVSLRGVSASYGTHVALRDVSLVLGAGECVALVGDNGSGKTTVARILAGLLAPTSGTCHWEGGAPVPGRGVALLVQDAREQLFCETVGDELAFGPRQWGHLNADDLEAWLTIADLTSLAPRALHTLSHGQLHRTAFAAVMATRPRVLILDEPTAGQDWRHLDQLMQAVDQLRRSGSAILLISHDFKLIHRHATRIVLLRHGQVAANGSARPWPVEGDGE